MLGVQCMYKIRDFVTKTNKKAENLNPQNCKVNINLYALFTVKMKHNITL